MRCCSARGVTGKLHLVAVLSRRRGSSHAGLNDVWFTVTPSLVPADSGGAVEEASEKAQRALWYGLEARARGGEAGLHAGQRLDDKQDEKQHVLWPP